MSFRKQINDTLLEKQTKLELQGHQFGRDRYLSRVADTHREQLKDNAQLKPEVGLIQTYLPLVAERIQEKFDKPGTNPKVVIDIQKNIQILEPERLAYLTLRHLVNITDDTALTANMIKLGRQVQADIDYAWFQKKAPGYLNKIEEKIKDKHLGYRHGFLKKAAYKVEIYDEEGNIIMKGIPSQKWSIQEQTLVGKFLLGIIHKHTTLIKLEERTKVVRNSAMVGNFQPTDFLSIKINPDVRKMIQEKHDRIADLSPVVLPAVIPPKPWIKTKGGCFHSTYGQLQAKMVRTHKDFIQDYLAEQELDSVMTTLNHIQDVPFRINTNVLDVMKESYPLGIGKLPAPEKELVEIDDRCPIGEISPFEGYDKENPEFKAWQRLKARAYDKFHKENSKRTSLLWKFKIADMFKDEPEMYFFWNMDYRGRIYPMQPYINPQMDDSGKSLIEFAHGKPVGPTGGKWLAIHGANVYGQDKCPLYERVQWVNEHEEQILDSANNPLDGSRFWTKADKPFQFLAFCFEWLGYKEQGEAFVSRLPLHTDGTCSGLQHFSALLRDEIGGKSVNLIPGNTKADVYQEVADVVNEILIQDAANGDEFAKAWLKRGVDRKVVKRNVMTFCYGATKRGFAGQLLSDTDPLPEGVDEFKACVYLGNKNWEAVEKVLVKAVEAMNYLQKLAHFVTKHGQDIRWTTPTGFKVVQDYVKTKSKRIDTWWGGLRVQLQIQVDTNKKDTVGSKNAIAPNYIHSLDASHLMLTTDKCYKEGINDLSFVHDSFGAHACNMEDLNRILRETFIEMYSGDLLEDWTQEVRASLDDSLRAEFDDLVIKHRPIMGGLDLDGVMESNYFFC